MKRLFLLSIICIGFLFISTPAKAEGLHLFINAGVITDDSLSFDPFLWTLGANLDFHIGEILMISPEANVVTYKFKFETFLFQPAILLNAKLGTFFVGGGLQKYFLISGDSYDSGEWGLKLNAGFVGQNFKIRGFMDMAFDSLFKDMLVGVQVGIGF